jgi:hypothetical protein
VNRPIDSGSRSKPQQKHRSESGDGGAGLDDEDDQRLSGIARQRSVDSEDLAPPIPSVWDRPSLGGILSSAASNSSLELTVSAFSEPEQFPHRIIFHRHVEVRRRDAHVRMTGGIPHLGQRPVPGKRMADERVPSVVDRQQLNAFATENLARRVEAPPQGMPRESRSVAAGPEGADELVVGTGAVS